MRPRKWGFYPPKDWRIIRRHEIARNNFDCEAGIGSMSDTKSSKTKSPDKPSASGSAKTDAKSDTKADAKTDSKTDSKADKGGKSETASSEAKAADKPSAKSGKSEASARESVGGASEVHYGYFSNVRNDNYRSGWDDIWDAKPSKPRRKKG
jgi:hypothetical protein